MANGEVTFFRSESEEIELIYCRNSRISYPPHTHVSSYTLGLVTEGSVVFKQDGNRGICHSGDFFVVSPDTVHEVCALEEEYSILSVCFRKDVIYRQDPENVLRIVGNLANQLVAGNYIDAGQIAMLGDAVEVLYRNLEILAFPEQSQIENAKNLLAGAPENPFPVEELSRRVFVSQYYLIREFKKRFGLTPHQYQMQIRIRKAQLLLLEGKSITEVALITGFCDQSHFDRWFKKMLGITPSDYVEAQIRLPDRD